MFRFNNDFYWLVGFIEGEGSFGCYYRNQPCITIGQVQREVLERAQKIFKDGIIYNYKVKNPNAAPFNYFKVCGPQAIGWMMTLYTFLSTKRQKQIRKTICDWKNRKSSYDKVYYSRSLS